MLPPDELRTDEAPRLLPTIIVAGMLLDGALGCLIIVNGLGMDMETRATATIATFGILALAVVFVTLCLTKIGWRSAAILTFMVLVASLIMHTFKPISLG